MHNKSQLIFNSVRNLKPTQIYYQLWYRVKKKLKLNQNYSRHYTESLTLKWVDGVFNLSTYLGNNTFQFINIKHKFKQDIDWNYTEHKKLWTYNLTYFDFLNQESTSKDQGLVLITDFIKHYSEIKDGKESYPTSLRIINWVKFISKHKISETDILQSIREDANRLANNLEYHLLGNHLLENGFALWFAAHLFDDTGYFKTANKILKNQLEEQILNDGGHFELSPMYHQLMLYRVLDSIQLAELNPSSQQEMITFLRVKASLMKSWLKQITFKNGNIPLFNDSANGLNPTTKTILDYSEKLGINKIFLPFSDSGYRKFSNENYEMFCDIGKVGPCYQAGHSHADTFNFELTIQGIPIIVDSGTSTYNIGDKRSLERSTKAHNTVTVDNENSSQVWSGFRVAKRAHVCKIEENKKQLSATHNGYLHKGVLHKRTWETKDKEIIITDELLGKETEGKVYFHLHPNVKLEKNEEGLMLNNHTQIIFKGIKKITELNTLYSPEFNVYKKNVTLEVIFKKKCTTTTKIKQTKTLL